MPRTDNSIIHVVSYKMQESNIIAVSVCPGLSRSDTIALLLSKCISSIMFSIPLCNLLQPILRFLAKTTTSAIQSVLHVLF
ncbi:hypothetical protein BDR07DRAFT_1406584, partial [Suillus spraguei]